MEERLPHSMQLAQRQKLTMDGVTEVLRFDQEAVVLKTSLGALMVRGQGLKLKCLSLDGGQVAVEGKICALLYEEPRDSRPLWRRLLG